MDPTKKRIRHVKRLAEAAVPLKQHWETPGPGRGKKLPLQQRVQSGNRRVYLVNRIALACGGWRLRGRSYASSSHVRSTTRSTFTSAFVRPSPAAVPSPAAPPPPGPLPRS